MCTCNATSALTSGPLALDVLLISLSCDLDLVASYYTNSWWFVQTISKVSSLCNDDSNSWWFMQFPSFIHLFTHGRELLHLLN
jgi:hypothetical protein